MKREWAVTSICTLVFVAWLPTAGAAAEPAALEPAPAGLTGRALAERVEDIFRGQTSYMEATMTVQSPRLPEPRRVTFKAWDDRPQKRSFIRILGPPKDKGMGFLKLHPNMWNYIPRVERTLRIPPSMMLQSWMGSDFTNDDLVRESSQLDDYDHTLLGVDPSGAGEPAYVLQYEPHEDAPVVWGRILTWVRVEGSAPLRQDFYDEAGERLREMRFSDIRVVNGRPYPHRWSMAPLDKEGHETGIEIHEIRFDEDFADTIFTKRHLTQGGIGERRTDGGSGSVSLELRLARRNIARNLRRTGLTVAATVFAVFLVVVFVSMAAGTHEKMIEDGVRIHSGHLQVSGRGYLEKRTLEQFVDLDAQLLDQLEQVPGVRGVAPRVVGFGLASKGPATYGVAVFGVDPRREGTVSTLPSRVSSGVFVEPGVRGIVLGERLASNLGAELGDELLLYSVAYSMETAYDLFTVVGTLDLPEPALERRLAVISLDDAQAFFAYGNRVSEIALLAADADRVPAVQAGLGAILAGRPGQDLELHAWNEVMPELEQFIFLDDAGMYIMLAILIVVVAFGILNTILMSVLERTRELGVMLALGLEPGSIFRVVYLESMLLAAVGLGIGLILALPVVLYLVGHPIPLGGDMEGMAEMFAMEPVMTFKLKPLNPIGSAITIFGVAALAALYPALKASRARPVDALRSM